MAVVHESVEERGDDDDVSEEAGPVLQGSVGGDDGGGLLVTGHENVGELVTGLRGEPPEEEVVDEEQVGAADLSSELAKLTELAGLGDVLDEVMGLTVEDLVAALDGGGGQSLGDVALSGAGRTGDVVLTTPRSWCSTRGIPCAAGRCRSSGVASMEATPSG